MKVLIADDHGLLLEGLTHLLEEHGIEVVGQARNGLQAVDLARRLMPDVIVMDIWMPGCNGPEATRRILADMPQTKIVIFSSSGDERDLFEAIKCGACGYVLKSVDSEDLITFLRQVQYGILPFSPGIADRLLGEFARLSLQAQEARPGAVAVENRTDTSGTMLSERQREVLGLVAQGLSYKEVGDRLRLSHRTIKYHMAGIMHSLHLTNRAQVVAYAIRSGLAD